MDPKDKHKTPTNELDGISDSEAAEVSKTLDGPQPAYKSPTGGPKVRFRDKLKKLLKSKKFWAISISGLVFIIVCLWFIQFTRVWMVNSFGVRTNVSISVNILAEDDQATARLKNATVDINGKQYTTNDEGLVEVNDQPYGNMHIVVTKRGYEEASFDRLLDFDPFFHKLGGQEADDSYRDITISLKSIGLPISFTAIDSLSGQPITSGNYMAGDLKVSPDENGLVSFKAPPQDGQKVTVTSDLQGVYNDKTFNILFDEQDQKVEFVPAGRSHFLSARDGAISLYSADLDGGNLKMVIPGTGRETNDTSYMTSPSGKYGILASSREGERSDNNTLLQYLYVVNLEKGIITKIDEAKNFQLYDWADDKLVYTSRSAEDEKVSIKVANTSESRSTELSSGYSYGKIMVSYDRALFVESNKDADTEIITNSVKRASLDSGVVKELVSGVSAVVQTSPQTALVQSSSDQKWHQYDFNSDALKDSAAPSGSYSRVFINSANNSNTHSIVIDRVDGKFVIISKSKSSGSEKQLHSSSSITGPIRWIQDDVIAFRIVNDKETADYAMSIKGGESQKITDVTAASDPSDIARDINQFKFY